MSGRASSDDDAHTRRSKFASPAVPLYNGCGQKIRASVCSQFASALPNFVRALLQPARREKKKTKENKLGENNSPSCLVLHTLIGWTFDVFFLSPSMLLCVRPSGLRTAPGCHRRSFRRDTVDTFVHWSSVHQQVRPASSLRADLALLQSNVHLAQPLFLFHRPRLRQKGRNGEKPPGWCELWRRRPFELEGRVALNL